MLNMDTNCILGQNKGGYNQIGANNTFILEGKTMHVPEDV